MKKNSPFVTHGYDVDDHDEEGENQTCGLAEPARAKRRVSQRPMSCTSTFYSCT